MWEQLYERALMSIPDSYSSKDHNNLVRFICKRLRRRAWNAACEWQVNWGDPHNPGKVHPDLAMVEEEDAP